MEYDEAGRIVREIHADGTEIPYEYDSLGRVIPRMEPGVLTETDEEGRLIKAVHEDGAEYHYEYGENGLLARVLGPEDETRYFYDPIGNLIERVDRLGHVTRTNRWEYDLFNQLTREEDPEGRVWQYEYNAYGEMVRATDPLGHDLTYSSRPLGDLQALAIKQGNRWPSSTISRPLMSWKPVRTERSSSVSMGQPDCS